MHLETGATATHAELGLCSVVKRYEDSDVLVVTENGDEYVKPLEEFVFTKTEAVQVPPVQAKFGKQRRRNYPLLLDVYRVMKDVNAPLRHDQISDLLDPTHNNHKLHYHISAVLSGNPDVFFNKKESETWILLPDADRWLKNKKPVELSENQKKAKAMRKELRAVEKSDVEPPSWFDGIKL